MNKTSLIGHVIELHDIIRDATQPADAVVRDFFRKRHYLGSKDRRFITEVIYALLRNFRLLQVYAGEALRSIGASADNRRFPSIALYSALAVKLNREEPTQVLTEIAGLWRIYIPDADCAAFISALEKVELHSAIRDNTVKRIAVKHSFADMIVGEWIDRFGIDETEKLCTALNVPAPTTIRVNTLKATLDECQKALESEWISTKRTTLSTVGLTLEKRINTRAVRTFQDGYFEMQDEGSQLIAMLVNPLPGEVIVDACAGGGGKTLHLAALMENRGTILAIDSEERRLADMHDRLERAGVSIAQVLLAGRDKAIIDSWIGKADRVLIDAPCTGVGTFRRNPGAKRTFSEGQVARMSRIQRTVLEAYAPLVKRGGWLVYTTCSLLKQENEDAVERFLGGHPEFVLQNAGDMLDNIVPAQGISDRYLLLLPHRTSTDGFFAAVLKRESLLLP